MIIAAYMGEGRFKGLRNDDAQKLTHVNFAFARVKDGKASIEHWKNSENVCKFIREKGNIKVVLSIGGWGAGGFSPAVATAERLEIFSQSLVDIVNDYGFDGVDLDWEYPCSGTAGIEYSVDDKPNFTAWVALLREKLGKDKIVSMAAGASESCANDLEIDKLVGLMDFFNIMTYDMAGWSLSRGEPSPLRGSVEYTSHHTSLYESEISHSMYGDKAMRLYEAAGIPREKLILGAAFYSRIFKNVDGINCQSDGEVPGFSGGYPDTLAKVEEAGGLLYDEKAEAPYAYNAKERTFITFDNERSLKAKHKYAKSQGLGGVMFWEYSCDDENSSLVSALALG
jgi:chitinase